MKKKRRKSYAAALKVKIALEAIKGQRTINEIATHYVVHPNQAPQWKKQATLESARCLLNRRERDAQAEAKMLDRHGAVSQSNLKLSTKSGNLCA
jgi:transposase